MTSAGTVRSIFNYTRDTGVGPEIYFYEPPHGAEPRRPGDDPREMTVHNGWDRATLFSLDREGFALRDFRSLFQQWDDDSAIRERFYGEAAEFVRIEVGATRLMIFDRTIRAKKNEQLQTDEHATSQRAPVMLVHCDYTPNSGPLRVRQLLPAEADELLKRRVAFYEIRLQRDGGGLAHDPHPISETGLAERLVGVIGVERRQLPQCLLPPHTADQKAKNPIANMLDRTLLRHCAVDIDRDRDAAEHKQPENYGRPPWLEIGLWFIGPTSLSAPSRPLALGVV
jgi:hypothetical protein